MNRSASAWRGVLAGLVGGVIAAGAMSVVHKTLAEEPPPSAAGDDTSWASRYRSAPPSGSALT